MGNSESPVLQMKRHPAEQYAMLSSPTAQQLDTPPDDRGGPRWGARPLHNVPTATSGTPAAGRPDAARVIMEQRSGIGPVSVGNGLFGR